jgi:hypothetical protein
VSRLSSLVGRTAVLATVIVAAGVQPALAATTTTDPSSDPPPVVVTSPIQDGADAITVGQATFTRTSTSSTDTTVHVHGSVPDGIKASDLCYDTKPFTGRVSPGSCPVSQGNTGTSVDYTVLVTGPAASGTLYFQFHLVVGSDTAYAGWQPGSPFYGNVAVAAPGDSTPVPVGTLGGVGLAGLVAVVFFASNRRSRVLSTPGGQTSQP